MAELESKEATVLSNEFAEQEQPLRTTQAPSASGPAVPIHVTRFEFEDQTAVSQGMERGHWTCNAEFIMAALAVTTDYSYIWWFPYMCYSHGGVVFMILYAIFLLLIGVPIFYMDLSLGQFCGRGPAHIWNFSPLFRGVGVGMVVVNAVVHPMYGVIPSWGMYYLFQSGSSVLPWSTCSNSWNTPSCFDGQTLPLNSSGDSYIPRRLLSPGQEYFENRVLQISPGIESPGGLQWELVGCRFGTVVLIFAALFWGVKVIGKVVLVTVPLIFGLLLTLFIRGMTLPGSLEGVGYLLYPSADLFWDVHTWSSACLSAMYTTGMTTGIISTLSSYKPFTSTALRDSFIVYGVTLGVGVVASIVVFSFFGALAEKKNVEMSNVVDRGVQAVFVAMAEVVGNLPGSNLWGFALFFLVLLIGLNIQIIFAEVVITAVLDCLPRRSRLLRLLITACFCGGSFLFTLPYLSRGGVYFFSMVDVSAMRLSVYILGFLQFLTVGWIYGMDQFSRDIKMMTGLRPPVVFKFIWCFVLPLVILLLLLLSLSQEHGLFYGSYSFPVWAEVMGWFISLVPLAPIPVFVVVSFVLVRNQAPLSAKPDWGPADPAYRAEYDAQKSRYMTLLGRVKAVFTT
ncbi:sodium- and chloride-dependent glycine transporter 2-like isoform X2 [Haliotis rufescens]|nr:sodium- and chloride-dependent glycine transporter 2-like isoform X2 [Haliotis rufescens]XP_046372216.2 sodium- and chloride-dependent glycine transporter 2-like isoform X2 [Haliotis rufescens]XP_046373009.2 sodium- and chloride-dependent glycine transporter 2-like isoform X2 [Haliotis rufescens]